MIEMPRITVPAFLIYCHVLSHVCKASPLKVGKRYGGSLKGENLVSTEDGFRIIEDGSPAHGHIDAVMTAIFLFLK